MPTKRATPVGSTTAAAATTAHAWEDTGGGVGGGAQVWERAVQEDAEGRIVVASDGSGSVVQAIRNRRKRLKQNDYALRNQRLVRDMIRYVYVVLDASRWMRTKDPVLPPGTRLDAVLPLLQEFVHTYFDENPLSHLGFVLVKDGEAEILSPLSSNSKTHKTALDTVGPMMLASAEASGRLGGGEFSLQNGLEVAGRSLGHQPRHGSREIVVLTAALSTCDPGSILTETLPRLQQAKIRVSCLALAAEMHICRKVAEETKGSMGVCLDKAHCRSWLRQQTVPPPVQQHKAADGSGGDPKKGPVCDMIEMGFPTRTMDQVPAPIHGDRNKTVFGRTAFACPQCHSKNLDLPTDCAVCGLKLVLSPHLARSFHHLFPVQPFSEVAVVKQATPEEIKSISSAAVTSSSSSAVLFAAPDAVNSDLLVDSEKDDSCCVACLRPFTLTLETQTEDGKQSAVVLRFACPDCHSLFCVDCDVFLHESLHNCPGCLSKSK